MSTTTKKLDLRALTVPEVAFLAGESGNPIEALATPIWADFTDVKPGFVYHTAVIELAGDVSAEIAEIKTADDTESSHAFYLTVAGQYIEVDSSPDIIPELIKLLQAVQTRFNNEGLTGDALLLNTRINTTLRAAMREQDVTVEALADRLGVGVGVLADAFANRAEWGVGQVLGAADVLGVESIGALIFD